MFWHVLASLSLGCSSPSFAAVASQGIEEITVTAERRPALLEDVPISIALLTDNYLVERNFDTLETATANQPSLVISRNSGASKIYLRGVGSQGNAGMDQAVSTYIDGVYHGRSRHTKALLLDVARIEVLHGPQSTHFGMNSSAGAVAVTTRAAELGARDGYLRAGAGNAGRVDLATSYNLPVGERLALRMAAAATRHDGYWDMVDVSGETLPDADSGARAHALRLSGTWQPLPSVDLGWKAETQRVDRDNPFAWQPGGCGNLYGEGLRSAAELDAFWAQRSELPSPLAIPITCSEAFADGEYDNDSPARAVNRSEFAADEFLLRLRLRRGEYQLSATTAYFRNDFGFSGNDVSHGALAAMGGSRLLWARDDSTQVSQELRLDSQRGGVINFSLGAYWHDADIDFATGDADARNPARAQFIQTTATQAEQAWSLFGEVRAELTQRLRVNGGLRWSQVEKTFSGRDERIRFSQFMGAARQAFTDQVLADTRADPAAYTSLPAQLRGAFNDERRRFSDVLPSLSVQYARHPGRHWYASWRRGFKAGGFNFRLNGLDTETLTFDSETVSSWEVGVKGFLGSRRLRYGIAAFIADYSDLQQNSNRGDDGVISAAVIRNAARTSSDGVEAQLTWLPDPRWRLDISAALLDARFDDYAGADCTRLQAVAVGVGAGAAFGAEAQGNRCAQDLSGARVPHAPTFSQRTTLAYTYPLREDVELRLGGEWFYSAGFFTSPHADRLRRQGAYHKFNAQLSVHAGERWEARLLGTNLTDRLTARQLGQDADAAVSALLDEPRRISLQVQYNFDGTRR